MASFSRLWGGQVAAAAGPFKVTMVDINDEVLGKAMSRIESR